ncbi:MAG: fibronectin type III domain-containing protein [bacterium]
MTYSGTKHLGNFIFTLFGLSERSAGYRCSFIGLICLIALFTLSIGPATAEVIKEKNWDGATPRWGFSNDVAFFDNTWGGDGRYDTVPETTWSGDLTFANLDAKILGLNDLDDEGENGTPGTARVTFNSVDISSYNSVEITLNYDAQGLDSSDSVGYELFEDGTGQGINIIARNTTAQGTQTISVQDSTTSVYLQLLFQQNGGSDYIGIDNVKLTGTPSDVSILSPTDKHDTNESPIKVDGVVGKSKDVGDSLVVTVNDRAEDTVSVQSDSSWVATDVSLDGTGDSVVANLKQSGPTSLTDARDTITVNYDTVAEPGVSNFTVGDTGQGTVTVNWDTITASDESGFSNYKIYYSKTTPLDTSTATVWDGGNDSTLSDSTTSTTTLDGLELGSEYYFKMTWVDGATNEAPLTGEISAMTASAPEPPLHKNWDGATPRWGFTNDVAFFDNGWGSEGRYDMVPETTWSGDLTFANLSAKVLGVNDLYDEGVNGTSGEARVTFDKVDVSSYNNVTITVNYDAEGLDSGDYIDYELYEDGTGQGQTTIAKNTTKQGTQTISVSDSAQTAYFELIFAQNGTSDYIGVDNVEITGTQPTSISINSPSDGHDTTDSPITVKGSITSAATGDSVVVTNSLGSVDTVAVQADSSWTAASVELTDGADSVTANLKDTGPTTSIVAQDTITVTYNSNTAPTVDYRNPDTGASVAGNSVSGTYVLTDPDADAGTVTVEVSDDSGVNWDTEATVSGAVDSVSSSSGGDTHSFSWDSIIDLGTVSDTTIKLRLRAYDGTDTGVWDTSPAFTVDNVTPKSVTISSTADVDPPDTAAAIYWTETPSDVEHYNLYRSYQTPDTSTATRIDTGLPGGDTTILRDGSAVQGDSFYYYVTVVDTAGNESDSSNTTTAPHVTFVKTDNIDSSHRPGDTIHYRIDYVNDGFGPSDKIVVIDAVPDSTLLADTASVDSGPAATVEYSLNGGSPWQASSYPREEVTHVRWTISSRQDPLPRNENTGRLSFRTLIE